MGSCHSPLSLPRASHLGMGQCLITYVKSLNAGLERDGKNLKSWVVEIGSRTSLPHRTEKKVQSPHYEFKALHTPLLLRTLRPQLPFPLLTGLQPHRSLCHSSNIPSIYTSRWVFLPQIVTGFPSSLHPSLRSNVASSTSCMIKEPSLFISLPLIVYIIV